MKRSRELLLALLLGATLSLSAAHAQDTNAAGKSEKKATPGDKKKSDKPSQASLASKSAQFGSVGKTDKAYTGALKASDFEGGKKLIGKSGAFKGTIAKVYTPRSNNLVILNFDPDYKKAMVAVVQQKEFTRFPDLKTLEGKEVVVTGKFINYQEKPELQLTEPSQVKIVK